MTIKKKARIAWEDGLEVEVGDAAGTLTAVENDEDDIKAFARAALALGCDVYLDMGGEVIPGVVVQCKEKIFDFRVDDKCLHLAKGKVITRFYHEVKDIKKHEVDEPYDIASERWEWRDLLESRRLYSGGQEMAWAMTISGQQQDLAAAAPELADMMRECLNAVVPGDRTLPIEVVAVIDLLRKLNVPNVAPWYKGGR